MNTTLTKTRQAILVAGVNAAIGAGVYFLAVRPAREIQRVDSAAPAGARLIDGVLPYYEFRGVASTVIHASPEQIFDALAAVSLADMPAAGTFIRLRYLPGRLSGKNASDFTNQDLTKPIFTASQGTGTIHLAEIPGREVVVGTIGKLHKLFDQQPVRLENPRQFAMFVHPGYEKLAMSWAIVGGNEQDGYQFVMENRTHALSADSRRKFAIYWWLMIKWGSDFLSQILVDAVKQRAERAIYF